MNRKVVTVQKGFSNSAMRLPWQSLVLECGHGAAIPGDEGRRLGWSHDAFDVPAEVECDACTRLPKQLDELRALVASGVIHHTRIDRHFGKSFHCYRLDPKSPSGFFLCGSFPDVPEAIAVLRERSGGLTPLSPTEHA